MSDHSDAVEDYEVRRVDEMTALNAEKRRHVLELATQFPRIWNDPCVDMRERKRIVRILVADVTLVRSDKITANVRLSGGATRTRPLPIAQIRKFKPELVKEVDALLNTHCDREIADIFNQRGLLTWEKKPFNLKKIAFIRTAYNLASRHQRLRERGMLSTEEVAARCGIAETTVNAWGRQGLITKCYSDSLNRGLWDIPSDRTVAKGCGGRGARPARLVTSNAPLSGQDAILHRASGDPEHCRNLAHACPAGREPEHQ